MPTLHPRRRFSAGILSLSLSLSLGATALALAAAGAGAQSYLVPPTAVPNVGTCNAIPFGTSGTATAATWSNQIYQSMATTADLGGPTIAGRICEIGFAPCGPGSFIRHFDTIEIVFAQTTATSLSTTFASNLVTNVQTVLKATNYDWHQTPDQWNRIGLDKDYIYIAPQGNLVVQITVTGARNLLTAGGSGVRRDKRQRVYSVGWTGSIPPTSGSTSTSAAIMEVTFAISDLHEFGNGCAGSNGVPQLTLTGSSQLGSSFSANLTNGPTTFPVFLAVALSRFEPALDLGFAGAPGCPLYIPVSLLLSGVTDASGAATMRFPVPNDRALLCARVYMQYFPFDSAANPFGFSASNYGRVLVGN